MQKKQCFASKGRMFLKEWKSLPASPLQPLQVAEEEVTVAVMQVHAVTLTVAKKGTVGTHTFFHPATIAEELETVLPHIHEVILVDVALVVVGTNAGTGGDRAVRQNGGDTDAGVAGIEAIAHLALVTAKEAFTAVADEQFAFAAGTTDEVHQTLEVAIIQLKLGISSGAPDRENGEQAPAANASLVERVLQLLQTGIIAAIDASDDIPLHVPLLCQQADGVHRTGVAVGMAAQPVVVVGKAVEADGDGMEPRSQKALQAFGGEVKAIRHHAPGIATAVERQPHLLQVVAHQRFAAGDDDVHFVRIDVRRQTIHYSQEVFGGHVRDFGRALAVTAAMLAVDVTPLRALPEELLQWMQDLLVLAHPAEDLQRQPLAQGKPFYGRLHGSCFFSSKSTS